jgi:hypothetical protein
LIQLEGVHRAAVADEECGRGLLSH